MVHAKILALWEAESGGSKAQVQPGQLRQPDSAFSQNGRTFPKRWFFCSLIPSFIPTVASRRHWCGRTALVLALPLLFHECHSLLPGCPDGALASPSLLPGWRASCPTVTFRLCFSKLLSSAPPNSGSADHFSALTSSLGSTASCAISSSFQMFTLWNLKACFLFIWVFKNFLVDFISFCSPICGS